MSEHNWIKSQLGHGETMCSRCYITNREAAVLGELNECRTPNPVSAQQPVSTPEDEVQGK